MALPLIPKKTFEVRSKFLPKGKATLVPFSVGQNQHLIQVKDSENESEKLSALKQIIAECIQTPGIDVPNLPLFLIEELFMRLFQNSTGEFISLQYECKNPIGEELCETAIDLELDVREFNLLETAGHTNKIMVTDDIGIQFKYPSIEMYEDMDAGKSDDEVETIIGCIEAIFDSENVYQASEHTKDELRDFWNQQTLAQRKVVFDKFFNTIPHMHYKKVIKCKKCGHEHTIEFNSLMEVFS